jgi:hypothetical protein
MQHADAGKGQRADAIFHPASIASFPSTIFAGDLLCREGYCLQPKTSRAAKLNST